MTDQRRTWAVASLTAIIGAGLGAELAQNGLPVWASVGGWAAAMAGGVLLVLLIASPRGRSVVDTPIAMVGDAGWSEFRRELRRSRRGERSLTLMRIAGPDTASGADLDLLTTRSQRLAGHLRLVDRTWVDDGSIYAMLPESPQEAAIVMLERVRAMDPGLLPSDIRVATFPEDGLTSGALIAAVHGASFDHVPTPIRTATPEPVDSAFDLEAEPAREVAR